MSTVLNVVRDELFSRAPEEQHSSWTSLRESAASQRRRCREVETRVGQDHAVCMDGAGFLLPSYGVVKIPGRGGTWGSPWGWSTASRRTGSAPQSGCWSG